MSRRLLSLEIRYENDLVSVRQRARQISGLLGYEEMEQVRIATSVSEIARNALSYAGGGKVEFAVDEDDKGRWLLAIQVSDTGPGIPELAPILEGKFTSRTGAGLGIVSARRLMDSFEIESAAGSGTTVRMARHFPRRAAVLKAADFTAIARELARAAPLDPFEEIRRQNQELVRTMEELRARQEELEHLNHELEDTNRGVVALYAELDEKALHLRRADELKSRFLSNMSHEFRTPLNSVMALSRMLLDRVDGDLTEEQSRQISYIRKSAQDLSELVNDLLDLAKVEAGRTTVTPAETDVSNLFGGLRGMFRPLLMNPQVNLVFEEPDDVPAMYTDEGKVSQILRNFISNALKFTERGEVRVAARFEAANHTVTFSVTDSGIGIPPEFHHRIFEEFAQLDNPIQKKVKGTGLGLPLARKLAELLGGSVGMKSQPGEGSTFYATIPATFAGAAGEVVPFLQVEVDLTRHPVLVIEDHPETTLLYDKFLRGTGFQLLPAGTIEQARAILAGAPPVAIILDILLPGGACWDFLYELKQTPATAGIPLFVVSILEEAQKGRALGADDYCVKPVERKWLLERLKRAVSRQEPEKILVVDDDDVSRYLLRDLLADSRFRVIEASTGEEGLRQACHEKPSAILLDLLMPELSGFEVLERLKADPGCRNIPVIVITSKPLTAEDRAQLSGNTVAILSKQTASRQEAILKLRQALNRALGSAARPGGEPVFNAT